MSLRTKDEIDIAELLARKYTSEQLERIRDYSNHYDIFSLAFRLREEIDAGEKVDEEI